MSFQQFAEEARGRPTIAPRLHQDVDDVAVLVHCPPEILPLPPDGHEELVRIPRVAHPASPPPQLDDAIAPGMRLGQYEIASLLGGGGMAEV